MLLVIGTVREHGQSGRIVGLVTDKVYQGTQVHTLQQLKPVADADLLCSDIPPSNPYAGHKRVKVEIFPLRDGNLEARTDADSTTRNNLLSLPIYHSGALHQARY